MMKTFADAEVRLAESLPGYESRPQQQALANSVEQALAGGEHLLAEAGCGTGKSLGYLIPAILSGKRVVVSTATKALQGQIANKDLPFLAEHLGVKFSYALLKGRTNYACRAKIADATPQDVQGLAQVMADIDRADADPDFMAEHEDFPGLLDSDWRKITTNSEECPGKRDCPFGEVCFAEKAKAKAKAADVVVVNHALFLTDLKVKNESGQGAMLDEYDSVIFDEAHEVEEYAGGIFGSQFTEAGVSGLCSETLNWTRKTAPDMLAQVEEATAMVQSTMAALWRVLVPGRIRQATLLDAADQYIDFTNALGDLHQVIMDRAMLESVPQASYDKAREKRIRLANRAAGLHNRFSVIVTGSFDDYVRWVEKETMRNGGTRMVIKVAPVSVAPILRDMLFDPQDREGVTAVLASATLSVNGSFDYIAGRLGIDTMASTDVGTPFDYAKQSALYIPRDLPDPGKEREAWSSMAVHRMSMLVKASGGRALLLFTSNKAMKDAYEMLAPLLPYTCMKQGDASNKVLAERFMADTTSVLFATRSFMTGVDFQGDALSLVVIDKLPFPVPTEPLTEARTEAIKRAGGNDFAEYTVPVMTLVLKQAFGRLIRHRNDVGCVAILDPRLDTKAYGKKIVASLPPARRLRSMEEVSEFFEALAARA